jgi:hypothetical protein
VPGAATRGDGGRRRRRRRKRRCRPKGDDTATATNVANDDHGRSAGATQATPDYTTSASADHASKPPSSTAALCFLEPDPLALAMCVSAGPPALVISFDSMLEELAAALVVSRSLEVASPRIAEPSLAPAAPSPQPSVQELPQLMPPRV